MALDTLTSERGIGEADRSIGRIVSVTGSKAIVILDHGDPSRGVSMHRPEMGTLLAIDNAGSVVLGLVSALSVPVPAQREGDPEIWIAELGLVGELMRDKSGNPVVFSRGVGVYPSLGDRVRIASKKELMLAFSSDDARTSVRVGTLRQDASIPAMIKVDEVLGKHFAILGTTGTGKSCTTALILRSILEKNPAAHIVLLDPHNEYATAFKEWAEVISPRNMTLPYWLLTFEELVEVLFVESQVARKNEIDILMELIPIAKARYSQGRQQQVSVRKSAIEASKFTIDTPVPYRISDLMQLIDERMGKLENKKDLGPYRNLRGRIEIISQDPRYAFMFGALTVNDDMAQVVGRIFRVPLDNKPITILELTGIPTDVVKVVVSVLCRMTFDFALWSDGMVPVTLVCEEAHRYVPQNSSLGFEPAKRAIARIAKEGRKYGASLCIVTQRPAEIDPTILSQCNTVFALRMANDRDQDIVSSAIADTGSGLLEFLSALGQREAIAFGDGVTLPVRIRFDELPAHALPRSSTARFSEKWQKPIGDLAFLEAIVERWRAAGTAVTTEDEVNAELADAFPGQAAGGYPAQPQAPAQGYAPAPAQRPTAAAAAPAARPSLRTQPGAAPAGQPAARPSVAQQAVAGGEAQGSLLRRGASLLRKDGAGVGAAAPAQTPSAGVAAAAGTRPRTARDLLNGWSGRQG
jgi:hypothetical protein